MSNVRRVYVEKKPAFAVQAKESEVMRSAAISESNRSDRCTGADPLRCGKYFR